MTGLELLRAIGAGELPSAPMAELLGIERLGEADEGRVVFATGAERAATTSAARGARWARRYPARLGDGLRRARLARGSGLHVARAEGQLHACDDGASGRIVCEGTVVHRGGQDRDAPRGGSWPRHADGSWWRTAPPV